MIAAVVAVLAVAVAGALLGAFIGDLVCHDPEDAWFRCLGEVEAGLVLGFIGGAAAGGLMVVGLRGLLSSRRR